MRSIAIIGSGPAALMAASVLSQNNVEVSIFEQNRSTAKKLLIAGKSGLNISSNLTPLYSYYNGPKQHFKTIFDAFSSKHWIEFINNLGVETFLGSTGRYFIKKLTTPYLLKPWVAFLKKKNVSFYYNYELVNFKSLAQGVHVSFANLEEKKFDALILCLGGQSWGKKQLAWPALLQKKGLRIEPIEASNAGFNVAWSKKFLAEAEGLPLKNVTLSSSQGKVFGELMITRYGLEGTPVYGLKKPETVFIDFKPDTSLEKLIQKMEKTKENLSALRRAKKYLDLSPAVLALLFHHAPSQSMENIHTLAALVKKFPVVLCAQRGLEEAISSSGGLSFDEVTENLELKKYPHVYVAGEMLAWDAPTGGFLIQACVSQGYWVALHAARSIHQ
ncbi:NAD(P)/FAD-dependent oxidoreductase [bacterium]|nr:NAD(P)/FAD-dependent oxidoreductase [bacterium]